MSVSEFLSIHRIGKRPNPIKVSEDLLGMASFFSLGLEIHFFCTLQNMRPLNPSRIARWSSSFGVMFLCY
jgi:hypothetical protein